MVFSGMGIGKCIWLARTQAYRPEISAIEQIQEMWTGKRAILELTDVDAETIEQRRGYAARSGDAFTVCR